jgi:hypothetical protein
MRQLFLAIRCAASNEDLCATLAHYSTFLNRTGRHNELTFILGSRRIGQGLLQVRMGFGQAKGRA